jgi:hypothetical protein
MRRTKLIVFAGVVGAALALPGVSGAAPPPTQDSVVLTGGPVQAGHFTVFEINATSGPSGENPTGHTKFFIDDVHGVGNLGGPVLCLAVRGNTATMNVQTESPFLGGFETIQVVDGQPDTFDASGDTAPRGPTDCSPLAPTGFGGPLSSGDITVVDAPALPTTKGQCRDGGWRQFAFKNLGRCIAFVNNEPK